MWTFLQNDNLSSDSNMNVFSSLSIIRKPIFLKWMDKTRFMKIHFPDELNKHKKQVTPL